ncbi:hypothetical protein TIFTF001_033229 [Ficus carica]|uniref:Peptidase metallopeptidase domain-containing protein n=1 Tax=Ficus carica TaxID=3494 RepID=A0AA88DXZ6_FICCA|nr:hypothetical protein TIFTF001_033229 [Ficus carica]
MRKSSLDFPQNAPVARKAKPLCFHRKHVRKPKGPKRSGALRAQEISTTIRLNAERPIAVDDNYFDDAVESAIKAYQINYNLPFIGTLDPVTMRQMMLPRCGLPNVINGARSTTVNFRNNQNENHDHDHDLMDGVSHYAFLPGSPHWDKYRLTYLFLTGVQVPGTENIRSICARAFGRWASVTPFTFTEVPESATSDLQIGFFHGDHGDDRPFDGTGGTLAHSFAPTVGWFHYDADENWSENPNATLFQVDLESVALHEIGHLLGLDHSNVRAASMYPTFDYGERRRELNDDDIQGIRALYVGL